MIFLKLGYFNKILIDIKLCNLILFKFLKIKINRELYSYF